MLYQIRYVCKRFLLNCGFVYWQHIWNDYHKSKLRRRYSVRLHGNFFFRIMDTFYCIIFDCEQTFVGRYKLIIIFINDELVNLLRNMCLVFWDCFFVTSIILIKFLERKVNKVQMMTFEEHIPNVMAANYFMYCSFFLLLVILVNSLLLLGIHDGWFRPPLKQSRSLRLIFLWNSSYLFQYSQVWMCLLLFPIL